MTKPFHFHSLFFMLLLLSPLMAQDAPPTAFGSGYQSEINIDKAMEGIRIREQELNEREARLSEREAQLQALQQRLNGQINTLDGVRARIEELLGTVEEKQQEKLAQVAKIYEAMKPKDAASVVAEMSPEEVASIFSAMNPRRVGAILDALGKVNPVHAAKISFVMKNIPGLDEVKDAL
ncbi:MotE family protein [Chrysiogenes arsenatis]|uniref:MotE family protein n=1 Tax=Chrysiogenes arsenatis TaxID=309797 RepID=UPI0004834814|nr:hypothetical protein [Chrysiogenes arsenatis]